jgi:hypothetical protein
MNWSRQRQGCRREGKRTRLQGANLESRVNEGPPLVLTFRRSPQKGILGLQAHGEAELRNLFVRRLKK